MKNYLYSPAFSINVGANVKVLGETSSGKSSSILHLVNEALHSVLKRRVGKFRSTLTTTYIHLDSTASESEIGFVGVLKKEFVDKHQLQKLIIAAFANLIYENNSLEVRKELIIEYLEKYFLKENNTEAVLMLLEEDQRKDIFNEISDFFIKVNFVDKLKSFYLEVMSQIDKYEKESVKIEALTEKIKWEIGVLFAYNEEVAKDFKSIYHQIDAYLTDLLKEIFIDKIQYRQVSLVMELDDMGNPKDDKDKLFYKHFFRNNNATDGKPEISLEILFESVHLKLPMSQLLLSIIENHPDKEFLKFGNSYKINYLDNRGLFHKTQGENLVLDELYEQMNLGKADICLNFINIGKNLLIDETRKVYKSFMSENRISRHNIFVFTHLDLLLFEEDEIDSTTISDKIRRQTSEIVSEIYAKSKVKNYSIIEFSNELKKLTKFEDELDISQYSPEAFIVHFVNELIKSLSFRRKIPTFEIPNSNIEFKLNIDEKNLKNFKHHVDDYFQLPQNIANKNNVLQKVNKSIINQLGLRPLYRSWSAAGRRFPYCGTFQSEVVSSRYDEYDNIDTEFVKHLPNLITEDFKDNIVNYLFVYVFESTDNVNKEQIETLKKSTKRYIDEKLLIGGILKEFYNLANEQWLTEIIYKNFLNNIEQFLSGRQDIFSQLIYEYSLTEFKKAVEKSISMHIR